MIDFFLQNIAWLRKHHGLSKREMAQRLSISVGTLNKIERGVLPPRLGCEILFAVYRCFGVSMSDILSRRLECDERDANDK